MFSSYRWRFDPLLVSQSVGQNANLQRINNANQQVGLRPVQMLALSEVFASPVRASRGKNVPVVAMCVLPQLSDDTADYADHGGSRLSAFRRKSGA